MAMLYTYSDIWRMVSRCGKSGASGIEPARPGDGCREVGAALKC